MALSYGCVVPHSPNLVPEVGLHRSSIAERTRESMGELGLLVAERRPKACVVVSPHSPFLPEAFGVWEGGRLKGTMARFQAPDVTIQLDVCIELAEAIVDTARRMELPVGRINREWELDRGVTVPALYLLKTDELVVPTAISMLGWDEHWLFGSAIAKAAEQVPGEVVIVASANLSHRVTEDAPHGYSPEGAKFDAIVRDAIERGQLRELLEVPKELVSEASECGMAPLLVLGGAFDGHRTKGRVLSYETPFGIGYLVAEVTRIDEQKEPLRARVGAAAELGARP